MHWLNLPFLPYILPLAAIPLIIHLLNKKFPHFIPFSSIELIRRSLAERSKLMQWRHVLLTLLRTLVVALAVLAFLNPLLPQHGQPPQSPDLKRHAVIVLDHSFSMEQPDGLMSLRSRAGSEALRIIDSLAPQDEIQIISAGRVCTQAFTGWSHNHAAARAFVTAQGPGYEHANFGKAIELTGVLLDQLQGAEIYFISDFQRTNWSNVSFAGLPKEARIYFVPVGGETRANRAVSNVEIVSGKVLAGGELMLMAQIANHSPEPFNEKIEAVIDNSSTYEAQAEAAPWSVQRVPLQIRAPGTGWHTLVVRLKTADTLPQDDAFYLPLHVSEKEEVIIATDEASSALTTRFLEAAINPYADNAGSLVTRRLEASKLTAADLASSSKLLLTRVNKLPPAQIRALAEYLKAGGGALWFLDGTHDAENAQALSESFAQPEAIPLRLTLRRDPAATGGDGAQIAKGNFDSRFLRLFRGPARESLAQLAFYELWQAAPVERANQLLTYADGTPALAQGSPGLGTLLMCNFSVAEIASNLARQRVFPAWIQEMTSQISGESVPSPRFEPGDVMDADAWTRDLQNLEFTNPTGAKVIATGAPSGERTLLTLPATEPGFYTLQKKRINVLLAANIAPGESDLRALEGGIASQQARQDDVTASEIAAGADYLELSRGRAIFHWFILSALLLLLLETLLQTKIRRTTA